MSRHRYGAADPQERVWRDVLVAEALDDAEPGDYIRATSRADDGRRVVD